MHQMRPMNTRRQRDLRLSLPRRHTRSFDPLPPGMSYEHSSVYIVKIVDVRKDGDTNTWYVGPYGSTRADQVAHSLEARDYSARITRLRRP